MIDIKELRKDKRPQSAWVVHALIDRLEAAEKELAELRSSMKFRTSLIGRTEAERDALRAKIKQMERQVPICRAEDLKHAESLLPTLGLKPENPLYALPGAKGEEK